MLPCPPLHGKDKTRFLLSKSIAGRRARV
jgi:hypothetical protein